VDPNRTALAQAETAAEEARSTATHVDPLVTVIADLTAGRTQRWLDELTTTGQLPDHHRAALAAADARTTLDQLLRTVELAGHDPRRALTDAVTASPLDGSTSTAQVLHFPHPHRPRGPAPPAGLRLRRPPTPRATRADPRWPIRPCDSGRPAARRAGARLAEDPPQWAREALGAVPDADTDPDGRARWEQRAGWAESYRELVGHDDPADALGAAPPAGLAEKAAVFHAAHQALDLPQVGADEERMSEGRLRARWAAWQRELDAAPRYVADDLETAHTAHRRAATDATVWQARADAEADPLVRDEIATAVRQARETAEQIAEQIAQLTAADDARAAFLVDSAVTRGRAERARTAAGLRGINLDDQSDRVTAQEWLDAHLADQRADEAHREVTEDDLNRDHAHAAAATDKRSNDADDQAADAGSDPAEPAVRRRVPPPAATTAAFDRAQGRERLRRRPAAPRDATPAPGVQGRTARLAPPTPRS
jgi:hypothetical protein